MQGARFLVLLPIRHDMFTVLEAFSSRLPVICSRLSSLCDLVETGLTGLMFTPGDANAFAGQVRCAISNSSLLDELADRVHAIYDERCTPGVSFDMLIGVYRSVVFRSTFGWNALSPRVSGAR